MQHWGWPARGQGGFPPDRGYIKKDKGQGQGRVPGRDWENCIEIVMWTACLPIPE